MTTIKTVRVDWPRTFEAKPAVRGTSAYEYLQGRRDPQMLLEDGDLLFMVRVEAPQGGLLYVFRDHSSVVFTPTTTN